MSIEKNTILGQKICKIEVAETGNVASILTGTGQFKRKVTFIGSADFLQIYGTPGTMSFEEPQDRTAAGPYYKQKVQASYPGLDLTGGVFFNYPEKRWIVKITYPNGTVKIVGSKENPCMFTCNYSDSASIISFVCNSINPAFLFET